MKLSVEFPSIAYREGPQAVSRLASEIERIGFDQIDIFDHVIMGYPTAGREDPVYPPQMPILEALTTLSFIAAVTSTIGLGTEVLILPQRQPVLVAKQVSTLDTLSNGRMRLGVGVGWQASEYEALEANFETRGQQMDEAIALIRSCWRDKQIDFDGKCYSVKAMAMEPKPIQGVSLPIWIGGAAPRALKRIGELGDGWLAGAEDPKLAATMLTTIRQHAESAGRDPATIEAQMMFSLPPRINAEKGFYNDRDAVLQRASSIAEMGFGWSSINATEIFQAGARSVDAIIERLEELFETIHSEVG